MATHHPRNKARTQSPKKDGRISLSKGICNRRRECALVGQFVESGGDSYRYIHANLGQRIYVRTPQVQGKKSCQQSRT